MSGNRTDRNVVATENIVACTEIGRTKPFALVIDKTKWNFIIKINLFSRLFNYFTYFLGVKK